MDIGLPLFLLFMTSVAAAVFFPKIRDPLARRLAADESDVDRLKAQGDTLVLFTALLGISLAVSSMIGIRALYGGTGALVPAALFTAFFTYIVVSIAGPAGMKTSAERTVQVPTESGRTVVMRLHKVEAVTVHHVTTRRQLIWVLWLAVMPPWVALFACLFLTGALGTPAEMPASLDVG